MKKEIQVTVDTIIGLYRAYGEDLYFGEHVTQLQHALQSAQLAKEDGGDDETVLAAFLHDIGHLCQEHTEQVEMMKSYGVVDHETVGANYLRKMGFSIRLCRLIASHVSAKRYLTYTFPEYYQKLSEASKKTLEYQGGVMSKEEAEAFQNDQLFPEYIRMRHWDESAKSETSVPEDLNFIKDLITEHLQQQFSPSKS